ncbi:hypothetical protein CERSUDRAFT_68306 [Gelatoporia subvermispora B]|uniref:Nephrocystin 3-like N-terminal domain-containing protein n=1 Tax=Ceriporiopsis subvermispora (strain B) TaxID=914234 RepID=M2R1W4_CERS8|nr:hypothetical protein CERSUDRAFT_68306 [Gelatoporia subvermispora B]
MTIFGLATEQVRLGRLNKYRKTLLGDTTVEDTLKRLNRLTSIEAQTAGSENISKISFLLLPLLLVYDLTASLKMLMQDGTIPTRAIQTDVSELNNSIAELRRETSEMRYDDMVRDCRLWLSPPDPSTNHVNALNSHHEGTATWFTEGEVMQDWKSEGSLWIQGKPGSGKTILWNSELTAFCIPTLSSLTSTVTFAI